jgi:hypothetical protein
VERGVHLLDVQLLPLHATRPEGIEVSIRIKQRASTIFKVSTVHVSLVPETYRLVVGAGHLLNN